jgi:inosine/xanthosine triphosphate pyrophosphatase family protein
MKLWCATTNAGKVREFRQLGADVEILTGMEEINAPVEDGETFEENAALKAKWARSRANREFTRRGMPAKGRLTR